MARVEAKEGKILSVDVTIVNVTCCLLQLSEALSTVYGNPAIFGVLTISGDMKSDGNPQKQPLFRGKRVNSESSLLTNQRNWS